MTRSTTKERILRAQVRLLRRVALTAPPKTTRRDGPAKFIQGWVVPRGYASVTQALDEDGQVWERVIQLSPKEPGKRQEVMDSWWEKIGMTRK